jgi:thiamine biosynthesis lipoprotein ApbE/Na+-translocating ferredoxin:NAD+ oxidoreductase RnfG subunit
VLTTSPQTDDLVGYSGPNNLLVGLAADGRVVGMELLTSGDTETHVRSLQVAPRVWTNYHQWLPREEPPPAPVVIGGSTLTSLAIAEAMQRRLGGVAVSLRFRQPVILSEVREWFPKATLLQPDPQLDGWLHVHGSEGGLEGYAVRTAPYADNVRGYRGPTECLVGLAPDGQTLLGVSIRESYDTPDYVERVRQDGDYLSQCAGFSLDQWASMDFGQAKLEGVSGATQTSYGIAEGIRRRFVADQAMLVRDSIFVWGKFQARDLMLVVLVAGAVTMSFLSGRGRPWVRRLWQLVLVCGYGFVLGDLLSLALLIGWAQHGVALEIAPGLVVLVALALLTPWATGRQVYCRHLCPHGVLQDWLRAVPVRRLVVPTRAAEWLRWLPGILLVTVFLLTLLGWAGDLAGWEPFDAWTLGTAAAASLGIALVGLVVSCFVPMAYCRIGCPTGAFLKFLRSPGSSDHWGTRDLAAAILLLLGILIFAGDHVLSQAGNLYEDQTDPTTRLGGTAFGTAWTVTTRTVPQDLVDLRRRVQAELDQIERTLSHWHPDSVTAQFNAVETTRPIVMPRKFIELLRRAQGISQATGGAFDVTVAPLARALGFGPVSAGENGSGPLSVEEARERVGWEKLRVDSEQGTVAKLHPRLELDLGALLQGYAADQLADWMQAEGFDHCLIDVGGELRAVGAWEVGVEDPRSPGSSLKHLTLRDAALATSGVYRGSMTGEAGERRAHILDPRQGMPVEHDTLLVSVQAPLALGADAWATALLVIGGEDARALAAKEGLTAFVVQREEPSAGTARRSQD